MRLSVDDDALRVAFDGLDHLLAFSQGVTLRWDEIIRAEAVPWEEARADMGWRTMGSYVPGLVAAGWYQVKGRPGRQLWRVHRSRRLLLVDTTLDVPCRVVLQVDDPDATAAAIRSRLPQR